jgi:hypothetical protein
MNHPFKSTQAAIKKTPRRASPDSAIFMAEMMLAAQKKFPLLFLLAAPLLAFPWLWLAPQAMPFDMADYFLPHRYFLGECFRNGHFPWWNPYSGLGIPFHADPQSGAFYPIAWMFGLIGYDFAVINAEYLLHLVIAGGGMYWLVFSFTQSVTASVAAALCYQLCGVFIGNAQHLTWIISAAWLPWVIYFLRKIIEGGELRYGVKLSLTMMLMTTGGYPAFLIILFYSALTVVVFQSLWLLKKKRGVLLRRSLTNLSATLIFYLLLTSPYLYSLLQSLPYITRSVPLDPGIVPFFAFTPQSFITVVFPAAAANHGDYFQTDLSMANGYAGWLPIIFLPLLFVTPQPRVARAFFVSGIFFLLLSFGNSARLWNLLFTCLPLVDFIRFPAAFRLFAILCFLLAAALVMNQATSYPKVKWLSLWWLIAMVTAAIFLWRAEKEFHFPDDFSIEGFQLFYAASSLRQKVLMQLCFSAVPLLLCFSVLFFLRSRFAQPVFHFGLLLVVAADMVMAAQLLSPATVVSKFEAAALNQQLKLQPRGWPFTLVQKLNEVTHEGDGTLAPSYYNNNILKKQPAFNSYNPFDLRSKDSLDRLAGKEAVFNHPLFYLLDSAGGSLLELKAASPNQFTIIVESNRAGRLVFLQNNYPGWKATVNGAAAPIKTEAVSLMAVELTTGRQEVVFRYDAGVKKWWLVVSLIAQTAAAVYLAVSGIFLRKKTRPVGGQSSG